MDSKRRRLKNGILKNFFTLVLLLAIFSGCRTGLDVSKLSGAEKSRFEVAEKQEKPGMFSRIRQASFFGRSKATTMETLPTTAGFKELEAAKAIAKSGNPKKAEREYKKIAKKYKETSVAEDALFLRAESLYNRKRYSYAQDSYTELMKNYPSTRYMKPSTQHLFDISQHWLGFSEMATSGDIQQVSYDNSEKPAGIKHEQPSPKGITRTIPIFPNFSDKTRPIFDTEGRALEALKSIWMNDPTGPLADDALMLTASYYLRKNDFLEADHVLTILRDEYPKSPHLENAFQLGSYVKLASYQGPSYEGKTLEESKKLKESTLRIFPDAKHRERTLDEIRKIEQAKAERDWQWVEYYQNKKRPQSTIIYCNAIINDYPHSEFATKAQQLLNQIEETQLAQNNDERPRRFGILPRRKSDESGEPDFDDELESLKKEDSPARLRRFIPKFSRKDREEGSGEPEFMEGSDSEIPEYDEPQFVEEDEELSMPGDGSVPEFDDGPAPKRLEFEPGEDSNFIELDEPTFDE